MIDEKTLTDEALLEIAKAATIGEWLTDAEDTDSVPCIFALDGDADDYGRAVVHRYDICELADTTECEANLAFFMAFQPSKVISLIERAQAAEANQRTLAKERADAITELLLERDKVKAAAAQAELASGIAERIAIERNALRRQRDDLLEANNGYLARARTAEEALKAVRDLLLNGAKHEKSRVIEAATMIDRALSPTRTEA